jgi:hypothetical protein
MASKMDVIKLFDNNSFLTFFDFYFQSTIFPSLGLANAFLGKVYPFPELKHAF